MWKGRRRNKPRYLKEVSGNVDVSSEIRTKNGGFRYLQSFIEGIKFFRTN